VLGVPLNTPDELKVNPGGSAPPVMLQFAYGGVPPLAVSGTWYVALTFPDDNGDGVVMESAGELTVN
jgi:hypothetical protein